MALNSKQEKRCNLNLTAGSTGPPPSGRSRTKQGLSRTGLHGVLYAGDGAEGPGTLRPRCGVGVVVKTRRGRSLKRCAR
jgi:hypothetical protein